jgi:Na+-driven multidrug efflux pump
LVIPFAAGSGGLIWYLRSGRAAVRLNFRGIAPRRELFVDILKVGVPGLINTAITNVSVVVLTGVAGHLGRESAVAYAMGARLEYILQPIAFGFGTAIVAMVGTNWGARQYGRARAIAWTGALIVMAVSAAIGFVVMLRPTWWMGLFTDDAAIIQLGTSYLHIVGPAYALYGLGLGLFFVTQGVGHAVTAVIANLARLCLSAAGGLLAITGLGLGPRGLFAAVAIGFGFYAALLVAAVLTIKEPGISPAPST